MRIINFSADGIESAAQQGFFDWIKKQDADVICIQDLRTQEHKLRDDCFFPEGYYPYFLDHPDNQNGVAIYTKKLPKAIMFGLGFTEFDAEARYIQADFDDLSIGSILLPEAHLDDPVSMARKAEFLELLYAHLEKVLNKRRQYIIAGNWQIAHKVQDTQQDIDTNQPGFLLSERRWLDDVTHKLGYLDAFRLIHQDNDEFSWWPHHNKNDGRRVDFQLISQGLSHKVEYGAIYKNQQFSSHAPVIMDYDILFPDELI